MNRHQSGSALLTYSEVLRVVGSYVDRAQLSEVRLLETDEGIVLQGRRTQGERAGECETYQLTRADIDALLIDAKSLRRQK